MVERVVGWGQSVAVAAACLQILYRPLRPPIHPIPIRPWSLDVGFGGSGRRCEADKRIALSRRNDIFDQHFHITPGRGASRITRQAELSLFFSQLPRPLFSPKFSSSISHPLFPHSLRAFNLFQLSLISSLHFSALVTKLRLGPGYLLTDLSF